MKIDLDDVESRVKKFENNVFIDNRIIDELGEEAIGIRLQLNKMLLCKDLREISEEYTLKMMIIMCVLGFALGFFLRGALL